jgi:hypothetical protein
MILYCIYNDFYPICQEFNTSQYFYDLINNGWYAIITIEDDTEATYLLLKYPELTNTKPH